MAFRFRLERVLRLRGQLRRLAQDEMHRTVGQITRVQDAMAAERAAQDAVRSTEDAAAGGEFSGADLLRWRAFEAASAARERVLSRERDQLATTLAKQREAVIVRRQDERKLERLRERARERYEAAEERATAILLDELALRARGDRT
jgi:flagellar export protein FliJ